MKELETSKIKILLVDDHPFVIEGIKSWFATRPRFQIVGEAFSGHEALQRAQVLTPDVVIMDISMPGMNGLEATTELRRENANVKVLILTCHEGKEYIARVIQSGARGFLPKNCPPDELVQAVEAVHRGEIVFNSSVSHAFFEEYVKNQGRPATPDQPQLTAREREVVQLIVSGLCNKEIASQLNLSVRTVEKHRERIMGKLEVHNVVQLLRSPAVREIVERIAGSTALT